MTDNYQMLMCKACCIKQKRLEVVKVLQLSTAKVKGMNTYAMYLCIYFFINSWSCDNSVFALSLWCTECRLMWKK